jgi:WD40 repeat protein
MRIFTGRDIYINSLRFSSDGRFLASDGYLPILRHWFVSVWDLHGEASPKHATEGQFNRGDGFTPNNRKLLLSQSNRRIALSLATGKVVLDARRLNTCETSLDRRWTVYHEWESWADVDRFRAVCRVGRRRVVRWTRTFPSTPAPTGDAFDGQDASFDRLGFAVNGTRILALFKRYFNSEVEEAVRRVRNGLPLQQEIVRVLDTQTGQDVAEWRGEPSTLTGPNAEVLYLRGSMFQVLDTLKPDLPAITRTNSSGEEFTAAAFSPVGRVLATTSNDATVTMWDTATWEPVRQYAWEIGRLRAVAFAPDGLTCAAGSDTGKVVLFDVDG